jgi:magnesium-transporting ATPase (P-type)|tara:strand:- start:2869 stop:3414 length:546 start_codon:yes stop_codon:yes gene_type:complete
MRNKRGFISIVMFFGLLFMILIIGFMGAMIFGIIDFASDEITPIMEDLGVVGGANVSEASEFTFGAVDKTINAMSWIIGFAYVLALMFSVVFAISYSFNPNPVYIGLYFMFIVLLIFGAIVVSNMYEDIYTGTDEIAERLQEQTLLSYMLLHSPIILTLIASITGIYIFARREESAGSFGV